MFAALELPAADAPKLIDHADAPEGALLRAADRLAGDDDVDRVGVQLRELPQRDPTGALDRHVELQLVHLVVGRNDDAVSDLAIDDDLNGALVPRRDGA